MDLKFLCETFLIQDFVHFIWKPNKFSRFVSPFRTQSNSYWCNSPDFQPHSQRSNFGFLTVVVSDSSAIC